MRTATTGQALASAENGSVSEAARQLYLSQSAISTAIAELEWILGTQLLVRGPRGLALTPAGRRVLADARRLLMSVSELVSNASQARHWAGWPAGRLALGYYSTLAPIMMPRVIAGLAERHPGIELDFMEGSHAFLERTLREGSCEIALLYNYEFHRGQVPEDFTVHVIAAAPSHLVLPAGHRLARRA